MRVGQGEEGGSRRERFEGSREERERNEEGSEERGGWREGESEGQTG